MDNFKYIVVSSDNWWGPCTLSDDVCLFQADGQPEVLVCL